MPNSAILITLGHHASAIYVDNNDVLGYEEERLNRKKATSAYPVNAISLIEKHTNIRKGSRVFVSHWFDNFDFHTSENKYFDKAHFDEFVSKYNLKPTYLSEDFTHHDAHAYSSLAFFRDKITQKQKKLLGDDNVYFIAADGFGNNQEAISIYKCDAKTATGKGTLELVERRWGYTRSLGLMYQYATSYCGMKENQDEYKFLGYESHIESVITIAQVEKLHAFARSTSLKMWASLRTDENYKISTKGGHNGLINVGDLKATKARWYDTFDEMVDYVGVSAVMQESTRAKRVVIGHFVQSIIERMIAYTIDHFEMKHVVVSGGIFYNVKLNNSITKKISGLFSVVPIAGDQGCAIGMYEAHVGDFSFGDLKFAPRPSFSNYEESLTAAQKQKYNKYISYFSTEEREALVSHVSLNLKDNRIVNVVLGRMEYGPRALCNTTTLALPHRNNVEYINELNERDTVMPMAPIMPVAAAGSYYDTTLMNRTVGSDRYMILTYDYVKPDLDSYGGVCHKYPSKEVWSGRPQLIDNDCPFIVSLFNEMNLKHPILINTSFNAHGRPIVYAFDSVFDSFKFEVDKALELGKEPPLLVLSDLEG